MKLQILEVVQKLQKDKNRKEARFASLEAKIEQWEARMTSLQSLATQLSNCIHDNQARENEEITFVTMTNPKEINAINLRSGKKMGFDEGENDDEVEVVSDESITFQSKSSTLPKSESNQEKKLLTTLPTSKFKKAVKVDVPIKSPNPPSPSVGKQVNISELPFPHSYLASQRIVEKKQDDEILDMFRKVEVNIPLLDLIKNIPKYAKSLKELCTRKRSFKPHMKVQLPSSVSALFESQLPIKCRDPGSFTIPCTIGRTIIPHALLDLGAAINVMPKSLYRALGLKTLQPTSVILQLADRTIRHPDGILEDVLVKVNDLVFPADFYVLDMPNSQGNETLILGRPFLMTANTEINMSKGSITMSFEDRCVQFNMYEQMKQSNEDYSVSYVNCIDDWFHIEHEDDMHTSPTHTTSILPPHGTTVLTDTMAKKCHTNPTMQEKSFVVNDC